jgi:hypothetical protein
MTTSGSFAFDPSFANLMDEAFEQAGVDPSSISQRHITSAKMSLNLMLTEWVARDSDALYRVDTTTAAVAASDTYFALTTGAMDIVDLVCDYSTDDRDVPMARMSRQDYLNISNKAETGRPTQFYVDQSNLNAPRAYLWPVPDAACTMTYDYMRYVETAGALSETLDVHRPWLAAVASGLALRLARKYNLERVPMLEQTAEMSYRVARRAGSGNSQVVFGARAFGAGGRTMRR